MVKINITQLKKELKQLEQKELMALIIELYKLNDDVKNYLSTQFKGEEVILDLYKQTKKKVKDQFFPERGFGKMKLTEAKDAISTFEKVSKDNIKTLDLMVYYVEIGTVFTNTYGDIDSKFYNSMISMFSKVIEECKYDEQIFNLFNERLENIVEDASGIGWGYHDSLSELYYSVEWAYEDEEKEM